MGSSSLIGQVLGGRYRIDEVLGQGGMSAVYKAYDPNLRRVVAVKVLHTHLVEDPKFLVRFEEEAAAVARLRHPNIVQVLDFDHDGDLYYMVQEYVPGETLHERLRRLDKSGKRMSVAEAIQYTLQISDAAGYAHRRGMIHRDIKPANVILDVHGQAILMDFGLVKITGGQRHTAAGAVLGTALYMPPEVIRGENPDPRSDLYSLGVTLYQMVSGHPPYEADSAMSLLMMHLQDPVPDVCDVRPDVPASLCAVMSRMLAKDRDERYGSMADLAQALEGVLKQIQSGAPMHLQATETEEAPKVQPAVASAQLGIQAQLARQPPAEQPAAASLAADAPSLKPAVVSAEMSRPDSPFRPVSKPAPGNSRVGLGRKKRLWAGAAMLLLALVLGLAFALIGGFGSGDDGAADIAASPAGSQVIAAPVVDTPAAAVLPTTSGPAAAEAVPPTAIPIVLDILSISLDAEQRYVADYEAIGLPEVMTTTHLHFFFNTVPFEKAGAPAEKAWMRYFGPSPFAGYTAADRPPNASQLCVQAANPNHTPLLGTGNCAFLPDVVLATSSQEIACLFGPGEDYPAVAQLSAGEPALVRGLSADELWWNVANPDNLEDVCWLYTVDTQVSGDIAKLPLVEGPPPGAEPPRPLGVEITGVVVNAENQYVVDHVVQGFTPAYPGIHIHFYFNTFTPDQVGIGGEANRRAHGGPSPFTGYSTEDRPEGATQLCAIVANPNHSVIPDSGNCYPLPNLPAVEISGITIDAEGRYAVDFVAKDFVPKYPGGTHIHFYFNIFTPDQVGMGGEANRRSHGAPPPFTGYAVADRPEGATQLCAIAANPDHSVIPNSGNCYTLPGLPTVEITGVVVNAENQYVVDHVVKGFTPAYPGTHIHFYFNTFTSDQVGIGGDANRRSHGSPEPFTGYAAADRPEGATQLCAIVANPNHSVIPSSGNCYHLPDVLSVEITGITVDSGNRYLVEYVTYGFTPRWPGTHVHFFFNTVTPEDLGKSGSGTKFSHGGSSPYAGYSTADRPEGATELCAIVANPENSVVHNSGNCFPLPDVAAP